MKKKQENRMMSCTKSFSELVLELVASADEVASLAKDHSDTDSESLTWFAVYLEKLSPILETIRQDNMIMDTPRIRSAICSLEAELQRARACISQKTSLENRPNVEELIHDLGRSIGLLLFASLGVSLDLKEKIGVLQKEMMSAKFLDSGCSSSESREIREVDGDGDGGGDGDELCSSDKDEIYMGLEEIEEEVMSLGNVEDVVLQLKYGNDDEFKSSLMGLELLIRDKLVDFEWIIDEGIVHILFNRLGSTKCIDRLSIIKVLRIISLHNDQTKEKMADINSLTTLVKSLAREEKERREAVGLLRELCELSSVRRRIGRIQGCIIMLVTILNGNDQLASHDAGKLLCSLSSNAQNALLMAEAGYFQPLIQHLREGSEMSKILMATALSRMVLTDKTRVSIGDEGAVEPLVIMFKTGKLEAKISALNALQNLSLSTKNITYIISSGILPPLLQLLFSVTSSVMTLREPASFILATIAQSDSILEYRELPNQLLSLLNLSNPKIRWNILLALNGIASNPSASDVRSEMNQNGAVQLLLPFIRETDGKIRAAALNLLYTISENLSGEMTELIVEKYLPIIVDIISSSPSDAEKAAAVGLLSSLPMSNNKATDKLKRANMLPMLVLLMNSSSSTPRMKLLEENVSAIFIRFTLLSEKKLQQYSVETGVVPILVQLLSYGSIVAKSRAATSLYQLAESSVLPKKRTNSRWGCVPSPTNSYCEVHEWYCNIKGIFCLVKAGAVSPLIDILQGEERGADEAALSAIGTLLQGDLWERGSNFIANISGGVHAILNVLETGTIEAKEKALWILDKIFRIEDNRSQYAASAQVVLIDLAHNGQPALRSMVAKLLAQLELLQEQSTYF